MTFRIDVYHHFPGPPSDEIRAELGAILNAVNALIGEVQAMNPILKALHDQVQKNEDLEKSAIVLLEGLAAKIEELKNDPAELQALADGLKASGDNLAAAIAANTPAAPTV